MCSFIYMEKRTWWTFWSKEMGFVCAVALVMDWMEAKVLPSRWGYLSEPKETSTLILFEDFKFSMSISRQISVSKLQYQNIKCFQYLP